MTRHESFSASHLRGVGYPPITAGLTFPPKVSPVQRLLAALRSYFAVSHRRRTRVIKAVPAPVTSQSGAGPLGRFAWALKAGLCSEAGPHRVCNEDSCYANTRDGIVLVADGIGGHEGGALASQILVDCVPAQLIPQLRGTLTSLELASVVSESIQMARESMALAAQRNPHLIEMGSTLVLGILAGDSLYLTHLGDSRAYVVRGDTMYQITSDHTLVQAMVDAGDLDSRVAQRHRLRHIILEFVGTKPRSGGVVLREFRLQAHDRLLFATDGLTDVVDPEFLHTTIDTEDDPQGAAERLVDQALQLDTKDNVSCVVVHVVTTPSDPVHTASESVVASTVT
ncbi:MAG: PP2C family serine/threonine-protein phosphatase [Pirellulaceae bacterium]